MENEGKKKPLSIYVIILIFATAICSILARFSIIFFPIALGVSGLYFPVAIGIPFALWFGMWGAIASYVGCFIGAGMLAGMPHYVNLYWSLADFWQALLPLIAFKTLNANVDLRTRRDFLIFIVFGWMLNILAGASWGASTLAMGGVTSWNDVPSTFTIWLISSLIITILITPLLLRYITPHIQKAGIYVNRYW